MECHAVRGVLRARSFHLKSSPLYFSHLKVSSVAVDCVPANDRRLYHHHSVPFLPRSRHINLLATSPLTAGRSRCVVPSLAPLQTRTIIISRVIEAFRDADITSMEGLTKFILESTPVTTVSSVYEWSLATTGLPCAANIVLCSTVLQLVFNTPAIVYLVRLIPHWMLPTWDRGLDFLVFQTKWMTRKEKHNGDMVAIKSSLMRSPSREGFINVRFNDKWQMGRVKNIFLVTWMS